MRLFPKAATIVLAVSAVGAFALVLTAQACPAGASDGPDCRTAVSTIGLGVAGLLAAAAALAWLGRVPFAWAAWGLATLATVAFPNHWFLLLPCAVGLMGLLLAKRPREAPPAD